METRTLKQSLFVVAFISFLAACSSSYIVPAGASGSQIFREACSSCHKAKDSPNIFFRIKTENRNMATISHKISNGGLIMPAYTNIGGQHLQQLSQFVLDHSVEK